MSVCREIFVNDFRTAEVRETQADYAEGIRDAMLVVLLEILIEVVANRISVVKQCNVIVQRLLVELLLV